MFDDFESILKEYESMIYHLLNKYQVNDPEKEYYQELVITLWKATREYQEGRMKFSTYAYSKMNYRLIDLFRKNNRDRELAELMTKEQRDQMVFHEVSYERDPVFTQQIRGILTEREWLWFDGQILQGKKLVEIARDHNVSADAVRNWKRRAVVKIRRLWERVVD